MEWGKIVAVLIGALLVWLLYRTVKGHPDTFSKENFSKSFGTMGILALVLIGFVAFCIFLLKQM